jgi:S1-C subfamily serine protease
MNEFGSGALLFADENDFLVATNRHVVDGFEWQRSKPYSGPVLLGMRSGGFGHAQIVGRHKSLDLLLLRVERHRGGQRFSQPIQDFRRIETGERVVVFGHPQGLFFSLSDGLVSRTDGRSMVQITAPISSGSSGGPVLDFQGRLLGIATSIYNGTSGVTENLNFATRSDAFLRAEDWNLAPAGVQILGKFIASARAIAVSSQDQ